MSVCEQMLRHRAVDNNVMRLADGTIYSSNNSSYCMKFADRIAYVCELGIAHNVIWMPKNIHLPETGMDSCTDL
jgi:hypothetical protein